MSEMRFQFFLSLYGHSLPVLCLDISFDSKLVVTGSADKNVKIWGMDFGDCHKSLFAHDDSVTCVKFLPRTHWFFSAGKDGKIKQWDADNFQRIQVLQVGQVITGLLWNYYFVWGTQNCHSPIFGRKRRMPSCRGSRRM